MNELPATIKYPDLFNQSQWYLICPYCNNIIGFDGVFDWGWVIDSIRLVDPTTKITPMDFDCVVERHQHYLIFETKDEGINISTGQSITLNNLSKAKSFQVMKVWGKRNPVKMELTGSKGELIEVFSLDEMKRYVARWFNWANNQKP